jgi:hypothetical protein
MNKKIFELYIDYLVTSFSYTTPTGLSELLDGDISGVFQDSCHSLVDFYAASSIGLSGFNVTAPIALPS